MTLPKDPLKHEEYRRKLSETTKRHHSKMKERYADPEWQRKHSDAIKKMTADPEWRRKNTERSQKLAADPGWQRKHSDAMKKVHADPEWRRKNAEAIKKQHADPEWRKGQAEITRKMHADPEYKKKNDASLRKMHADPEWRHKNLEHIKKMAADPEWHRKHDENVRRHFEDSGYYLRRFPHTWYGTVTYDEDPYCDLWTEPLKDRIRGSHGYICVNCGTPQNGLKLSAHHVHWNKKACCDNSKRHILPLCPSCHGLMKGNKEKTRQQWRDELAYLCEQYYCLDFNNHDKSFLSEEQWNAIRKAPHIPPETRYIIVSPCNHDACEGGDW